MRLIDADALDAKVEEIKWLQTSFAAALVFDAVTHFSNVVLIAR